MANLRANRITSTEVFETTGSVQFDGITNYLKVTNNADLRLGQTAGENFTIEGWFYNISTASYPKTLISLWDYAHDNRSFIVELTNNSTNDLKFSYSTDGTSGAVVSLQTSDGISTGEWHHFSVTKDNEIRIYVDGILRASTTISNSTTFYAETSDEIRIGAQWGGGLSGMVGHISNLRVLKGTALYTANFTPPTRELEVIPNTVLLACQHKTDATHEKTGKTITVNGNAVANELTPGLLTNVVKSGGSSAITGSVEFDGTGDYLNIPYNSDLWFSDQNWTIECWVHPNTFANYGAIWEHGYGAGSTIRSIVIYINQTDGLLRIAQSPDGSTNYDTSLGVSLSINSWHHLAVVRNGSTVTAYLNGIAGTSVTAYDLYNSTTRSHFIGAQGDLNATVMYNGFLSNFRILKGTALYTSDFIPPTRKLTKLPGTVLLCCQDSNDPTTEATGKIITGYGDLVQVGISTNLADSGSYTDGSTGSGVATFVNNVGIITGTDSSNRGILYKTVSVIQGNKYEFSFRSTDASTNGKAGVDSNDGTNDVLDDVTNTPDLVYFSGSTVPNLDTTTGLFRQTFTATTNEAVLYFQEIGAGTLQVTDITLTAIDGRKGSDFTPSVGSDDSVEFAGPITINTENYFYLPTGPTEQRGRGRGVFMGGYTTSPSNSAVSDIHYIEIQSTGNSFDFGDLVNAARWAGGASSSSTRAIYGGGSTPGNQTHMDYITISTTSNAIDYADLSIGRGYTKSCSNAIRGVWAGGRTGSPSVSTNTIEYVNIATTGGTGTDYGDLSTAGGRTGLHALSSSTRAVFAGGYTIPSGSTINVIDYISILSGGTAVSFGNLSVSVTKYGDSCSNGVRGIFAGGTTPTNTNSIQYVTIASTGNSQDFGDLTQIREHISGTSNSIRGIFAGGVTPTYQNTIDYVTISSTGNAQDFGDVSRVNLAYTGATSDSHGGLS